MVIFGLAEGRPQSAENKISVIMSKEANCFCVFWFCRGPPLESMTTFAKNVKDNLKQFLGTQILRRTVMHFVLLFSAATNKKQNKTTEKNTLESSNNVCSS